MEEVTKTTHNPPHGQALPPVPPVAPPAPGPQAEGGG